MARSTRLTNSEKTGVRPGATTRVQETRYQAGFPGFNLT